MKKNFALTPIQILALGFGFIILFGAILLSLPACSNDGKGTSFINGLFTATSATCVTGLSVYDIYSQYNSLGQFILLVLIQVGGLGFIAVAMIFSTFFGSKITLRQKTIIAESIGATKYSGIIQTIKRMFLGTIIIETLGAIIIATRFYSKLGLGKSLWFGAFHSVSAFCNAGFDLMGRFSPGSSIITRNSDPFIEFTIMFLIVSGGLGFIVWNDIATNKLNFKKYPLHSKIMIIFTGILIITGAVIFFLLEGNNSFKGMSTPDKLMNALFASITPRTAGFGSVDYQNMSTAGRAFTMVLMIIGAGPGSTGGGLKVTTFVVLILGIQANVLNYNDYSIFKRRITKEVKSRAFSNASAYMLIFALGAFALLILNPNISTESALYESISALGTVGLSLGLTPSLGFGSKIVLIVLMYMGRIGSLSIAMAVARKKFIPKISYPEENITV